MGYGFLRVVTLAPKLVLGNPKANKKTILDKIDQVKKHSPDCIVFPELALTGFSLGDLFEDQLLLKSCEEQTEEIVQASQGEKYLLLFGLALNYQGKIYNVMAAVQEGRLLGLIPKNTYSQKDIYDFDRVFSSKKGRDMITFAGQEEVFFGPAMQFQWEDRTQTSLEVCFTWDQAYQSQADLIVLPQTVQEAIGLREKRMVRAQALSLQGKAVIFLSAGQGESTTDRLFSGEQYIYEAGDLVGETPWLDRQGQLIVDLDIERIQIEHRRADKEEERNDAKEEALILPLDLGENFFREGPYRTIDPAPFIPEEKYFEEILDMVAQSVVRRMTHISNEKAFIGISGGLDSTLAVLILVRAFEKMEIDKKNIRCITMPAYGTSKKTRGNAWRLGELLGLSFEEIDLTPSLQKHFSDIGIDETDRSLAFENAQARERTQILMDLSNKEGGIVIGTGDMSEIALGWSTYNGDHMSMYAVNSSLPKTLVRELVRYEAKHCGSEELAKILIDIVDTPVSPELLPGENGEISQKTEDIIGPYEIHDFYLYHYLRYRFRPGKLLYLAENAFQDRFSRDDLLKSLRIFFQRFFNNQFKRSASPDSISVWDLSLSPRGGWRMPSDAEKNLWMEEIDSL